MNLNQIRNEIETNPDFKLDARFLPFFSTDLLKLEQALKTRYPNVSINEVERFDKQAIATVHTFVLKNPDTQHQMPIYTFKAGYEEQIMLGYRSAEQRKEYAGFSLLFEKENTLPEIYRKYPFLSRLNNNDLPFVNDAKHTMGWWQNEFADINEILWGMVKLQTQQCIAKKEEELEYLKVSTEIFEKNVNNGAYCSPATDFELKIQKSKLKHKEEEFEFLSQLKESTMKNIQTK